jgi:rfaE bifunctional protein nucleotidyltransferase chain/domain
MKEYFDELLKELKDYLEEVFPELRNELEDKIVARKDLASIVNRIRRENKTIVTTNGSFDILHVGHVLSLDQAASLGDILIVGLNSDSSIKQYKSGEYPERPINNERDRAIVLASLMFVDYVSIFDEVNPLEFLRIVRPDYHVKSEEGFKGIERKVVEENGGEIVLLKDFSGVSTTIILNKIYRAYRRGRKIQESQHSVVRQVTGYLKNLFSLNKLFPH